MTDFSIRGRDSFFFRMCTVSKHFFSGKQELRGTLTGSNQGVMSVCFDSDASQVLGSSNDYACRIWTLSDQRCRVAG